MDYKYGVSFPYTAEIYYRASSILIKRDKESRSIGAEKLREMIDEFTDNKFQADLEEYIHEHAGKLADQGGWELSYLPDRFRYDDESYRFQHQDVVELLEQWPDPGNLPDGYPERVLSDLEALDEILNNGMPYYEIYGFLNASEAECYAVLAMKKVVFVQAMLLKGKESAPRSEWSIANTILASELMTEAMELICHAEQTASAERASKYQREALRQAEIDMRREIKKSIAQNAAKRRLENDPKQLAKQQVRECWESWQSDPDRYNGKAAFARDMLSKYEELKSQPVIEGWCREWESSVS